MASQPSIPEHTTPPSTSPTGAHQPDLDSDTDSILAQLESELNLSPTKGQNGTSPRTSTLLSARQAELQSQLSSTQGRTTLPSSNRGLQVPTSEEHLIRSTADAPAALVVFYSASFASSLRMRGLVGVLAEQYLLRNSGTERDAGDGGSETAFFAAEAERCEWLCRRLGVKVLPVVVGYVDGREVGRLLGFEGLRGGENAGWEALGWIVGRWEGSWSGTIGKEGGSVLGRRWLEWVGGGGGFGKEGERDSDDGSDEDDKEERRRAGFIGGARSNQKIKIGGRQRRSQGDKDDDDDWD